MAADTWKKIQDKLEKLVEDVTTLTVITYTKEGAADRVERARTNLSLDGDTEVVIPVNADGTINKDLLDIHVASVKAASEARAAVIRSLGELFRK